MRLVDFLQQPVRDLIEDFVAKGGKPIDAPVTGSVDAAIRGDMPMFVGGDEDHIEQARPVIEAMGEIRRVGRYGNGYVAKLVNNQLWKIHAAAVGEAMVCAKKAGIEPEVWWDVMKGGAADSFVMQHDVPSIFAGHYDPSFPLKLCLKDLKLIDELMDETGTRSELTDACHARFREAVERYGEDAGEMTVCRLIEEDAGVELRVEEAELVGQKRRSYSRNVATARLGLDVGLNTIARMLAQLRIPGADALVPADLLGSISLTPLEVTRLYQTLSADGFDAPLRTIAAVHGPNDAPLKRYGLSVRRALASESVFLLDHALQEVTRRGTARALQWLLPERRVAGKTGTTNDLRDSWFAGFDGRHVGVVWVGRDDNTPAGLSGSAGALRVWADMMRRIPANAWRRETPRGVVWARVNPETGHALPEDCEDAPRLPFIDGTVPAGGGDCGGGWFENLWK